MDSNLVWHNDGHQIQLSLNRSELLIVEITCPQDSAACIVDGQCVVKYFISTYGMECNIGICPPTQYLEICWALIGNQNDIESCQLWFVPINDEAFYAWMTSRLS